MAGIFPKCCRWFIVRFSLFMSIFEWFFGCSKADNDGIIIFLFNVLNNIGFRKVSTHSLLFATSELPIFTFLQKQYLIKLILASL